MSYGYWENIICYCLIWIIYFSPNFFKGMAISILGWIWEGGNQLHPLIKKIYEAFKSCGVSSHQWPYWGVMLVGSIWRWSSDSHNQKVRPTHWGHLPAPFKTYAIHTLAAPFSHHGNLILEWWVETFCSLIFQLVSWCNITV